MEKGTVLTCNGCLAFSPTSRRLIPGSIYSNNNRAWCEIGYDIVPIQKNYSGHLDDYLGAWKPETGLCPKPKSISELVKEKSSFYNKIENEQ